MTLSEFQDLIDATYRAKDSARGVDRTFLWFVEEVGELAEAIRHGTDEERRGELGDVLAWLTTLATMAGIRLEDAAAKYAGGCPRCHAIPCRCAEPPRPV
ncbi:MAG: MazG nucleotide pyrophosphohydrolase domain-containing protein [Planctomycetota bacterium]